jgi:hypothetical protein
MQNYTLLFASPGLLNIYIWKNQLAKKKEETTYLFCIDYVTFFLMNSLETPHNIYQCLKIYGRVL